MFICIYIYLQYVLPSNVFNKGCSLSHVFYKCLAFSLKVYANFKTNCNIDIVTENYFHIYHMHKYTLQLGGT